MTVRLWAAQAALNPGFVMGAFGTLALLGPVTAANLARSPLPAARTRPLFKLDFEVPLRPRAAVLAADAPAAPAAPVVWRFSTLDPARADRLNASLPLSSEPIIAAQPFHLTGTPASRALAQTCLTEAVYYEAASESVDGQRAVAQVVLNRVRHPAFPHSVCGVVHQGADGTTGCQFSFTCDGSLLKPRVDWAWRNAQMVAVQALHGRVEAAVGGATHYHTRWVAPYWAPTVAKIAVVGVHIFYRWAGEAGLPAAFSARYDGVERMPAPPSPAEPLELAEVTPGADGRGDAPPSPAAEAVAAAPTAPRVGGRRVHMLLDAQGYATAAPAAAPPAPAQAAAPPAATSRPAPALPSAAPAPAVAAAPVPAQTAQAAVPALAPAAA